MHWQPLFRCTVFVHSLHAPYDTHNSNTSLLHHVQSMYDYLKSICSDVIIAQGDFDESTKWPDTAILTIGDLRIGVCHGHQVLPWGDSDALAILQSRLNVDILVTGHTHAFSAYQHGDRLILNPGSVTGVLSSPSNRNPTPSFALMDVNKNTATVYVYELVDGEIKVDKVEYVKE